MPNGIPAPHKSLSELEHQIMEILWAHGPATSDQVRNALAAKHHPLKDSTVRTILRRLQEKGYVGHKVEGRTFVYMGVEAPRNLAVRAVRQIIDRFCDGSVEQLLVGMVEDEMVNRRELQQMAQKIAQRKAATGHQ
jgi:BlaI family penicillinase repressor